MREGHGGLEARRRWAEAAAREEEKDETEGRLFEGGRSGGGKRRSGLQ